MALAATVIAAPVAACCVSEHGAPRTEPMRGLIHQIAISALQCGSTYDIAVIKRTCARRDRLMDQARRMGWCWGLRDADAAEYELYWLPCSKDRRLMWQPVRG